MTVYRVRSHDMEASQARLSRLPVIRDVIRVKNLLLMVSFTDGAQWMSPSPKLQPVYITLTIAHDITRTAETDDLVHSVDYSSISKTLMSCSSSIAFASIESLCDHVLDNTFAVHPEVQELSALIIRPRGLQHPAATKIQVSRTRAESKPAFEELTIMGLECRTIVGINPCEREEFQLVHFDISFIRTYLRDVPFAFRELAQRILAHVMQSAFLTLEALASSVAKLALELAGGASQYVTVRASKPSAIVCADAPEVEITRSLKDGLLVPYVFATASSDATDVNMESAPGTPSRESPGPSSLAPNTAMDIPADQPSTNVDTSPTLSALASSLSLLDTKHNAAIALGSNLGDRFANIELALRLFEAPGVHYNGLPENAFAYVVDTSFMYETEPMYVSEQPKFINCACLIETSLKPLELLTLLKRIETIVGRVSSFRNGPRAIDLDILTYDTRIIDTRPADERTLDDLEGHLVVPHPRMLEREFVLRPLNDFISDYVHPQAGRTIRDLFTTLTSQSPDSSIIQKVTPFPRYPLTRPAIQTEPISSQLPQVAPVPPTASYWKFPVSSVPSSPSLPPRKTYIMGTLNVTPDSFSDGSVHNAIPAALAYAKSSVAAGADIIDVGGYSTRPGASFVSPEEELSRVVPIVQAIRTQGLYTVADADPMTDNSLDCQTRRVLISVDTFRWEVAEEAVHAGANCINDVYAFSGPEYPAEEAGKEHFVKMRQVARDLAVPVILMHSRGEASANKDYSSYNYACDAHGRGAVIEGVKVELGKKVDAAVKGKGGLRRWFVIVDPGIGFSKTLEGNLEVLRGASEITADTTNPSSANVSSLGYNKNPLAGYPILIGTSRKSFLGTILERPDPEGSYAGRSTKPNERGWATGAAVACAVQQGAAVVRVHGVLELGDVVRVASAIWG